MNRRKLNLNLKLSIISFFFIAYNSFSQKVIIYAYPISDFTNIPIVKATLKDVYKLKQKSRDKSFPEQLENILKKKQPVDTLTSEELDKSGLIRILVEIYNKKEKTEIIIDRGAFLCWKGKCYKYDKELSDLILTLIPKNQRQEYIPYGSKFQ